MSERVLDRVMELADQFKEMAIEAEKIGKLPDATVKSMKAIGSIRERGRPTRLTPPQSRCGTTMRSGPRGASRPSATT